MKQELVDGKWIDIPEPDFNLKEFFLQERKSLTVKDIKSDINWLYRKTEQNSPIIIIFKSDRKYRKFLREETSWNSGNQEDRFGLCHELDFFTKCKMNFREKFSKDINRYVDFLSKGVWELIPTTKSGSNIAVILQLPKKLRIDEDNRYHSLKNPAIQWHDNKGVYFIHGARFPKPLFKKVANRELKSLQVLEIGNIEQRSAALRIYGVDKLMNDLHPQFLDSFERTIMGRTNKIELYRLDISDPQKEFDDDGKIIDNSNYIHIVKYSDPSTDRQYTSFVPNTIYLACSAMAWKNSLRTIAYVKHLKIQA